MPLIRAAVYSYLTGNAGITAQVGARVFPVKEPQATARPVLLYRVVKIAHHHDLSGATGESIATFEFNCAADTYAAADAVAEAVRQAADGANDKTSDGVTIYRMELNEDEGETDDFIEPIDAGDDGVFLITLRYDVHFAESVPAP